MFLFSEQIYVLFWIIKIPLLSGNNINVTHLKIFVTEVSIMLHKEQVMKLMYSITSHKETIFAKYNKYTFKISFTL